MAFDLEDLGERVKLTVTHDGFPSGSKVLQSISGGWPIVLSDLKTLLETEAGTGTGTGAATATAPEPGEAGS